MNPQSNMETQIGAVMNVASRRSSVDISVRNALVAHELEIMAAARKGSATAFDELQRRYSGSLFKSIFRITKNREDAEDALQDTFLRAYLALPYFEGRSSVYSWLTRIAINSALMVLRRRRTRPDSFLDSSFEGGDGFPAREITDSAPNPEQLCEQRQRSSRLLNAIRSLKPVLRAPIEIQLAAEPSMKELADTLNISVAAVKARLHRARVHLADRISKHAGAKQYPSPVLTRRHATVHPRNGEQRCKGCD